MTDTTQQEITLSAEQKAVFDIMEQTRQHLFITGRAGTGKSVLLRHFRSNTKKKVVVCAPTGIAALNVRGQTIHSLFRFGIGFQQKGMLQSNPRACMLLKRIDTVIIDEISMVRADLLDAIDERLREAHHNNLPFGGVQIIMFGDCYQLPPVVEEGLLPYFEHTYGGYFFFHADVWKRAEFKIYELSQVFRQKDPTFKVILNGVRDGTVADEQITQLNERCGVPVPGEGTITLATTNALVTNINQRKLDALPGKMHQFRARIDGEMKKGTFPTEEVLQLKEGAQVVLLNNDKDKRWVNGTVATISKLKKDDKEEKIIVHVEGVDYQLEQNTWEEIRYEYDPSAGKVKEEVVSSFTQYPIRLAWAMTVHKSQGQTYESVALDLTTATFAPGQLYVALSRCTSLEGLYLKLPVKRSHIIVEARVKDFMAKKEPEFATAVESSVVETVSTTPLSLSEAPEMPVIVEAVNHTAETSNAVKSGRKALDDADKLVKTEFRSAQPMKEALSEFVEHLAGGDFHTLLPDTGDVLALADIVNAALLNYEPFMRFFQQTEHYAEYQAWLERQRARQAITRKAKGKQQRQQDDQRTPLSEEAIEHNHRELEHGGWLEEIITPAGKALLLGLDK